MAATGLTAVRDALAAHVAAAWNPTGFDAVVTSSYPNIDSATHKGRKVYLLRSGRADEVVNRGEDQNDYAFVVLVVEKYRDSGDPPEAWIDERVAWVEWLLKAVGDARTVRLLGDGSPETGLWPEVAEIAVVLDAEEIADRKLFVSQLNLTYREQVEP